MRICEKCLKEVKAKEDYFKVESYLKGKIAKTTFMHMSCHKEIENQKNKMANYLKSAMEKIGIKQPDEIVNIQ